MNTIALVNGEFICVDLILAISEISENISPLGKNKFSVSYNFVIKFIGGWDKIVHSKDKGELQLIHEQMLRLWQSLEPIKIINIK